MKRRVKPSSKASTGGKPARTATRVYGLPARSQRLPREERERHIVQEAIRFFAEAGFGGDTRELAKRLNVTHPLLFRYFPSKEALIERVYQEVYIGRWNPYWELIIEDRSIPIRARMVQFYKLYAKTILAYEWVRLFTDQENRCYKVFPAPAGRFSDPQWPALKEAKIFRLAFRDKGRLVDSPEHPLFKKWAARDRS
jgi:AcrR family transcriptional regulator